MEANAQHHYLFRVTRPAKVNVRPAPVTFDRGIDADTHIDALNTILSCEPSGTRAHLLEVSPIGDGCGDDRCAVCNPSSRNRAA